jgi:hypothetical protein
MASQFVFVNKKTIARLHTMALRIEFWSVSKSLGRHGDRASSLAIRPFATLEAKDNGNG